MSNGYPIGGGWLVVRFRILSIFGGPNIRDKNWTMMMMMEGSDGPSAGIYKEYKKSLLFVYSCGVLKSDPKPKGKWKMILWFHIVF